MWDFSLFAFHFFFPFFNYWLDIFSFKPLFLYTQQEEESFIWEDKYSSYTVARIDKYEKDYRMYLGISAVNDKFYHPH